MLTSAGALSVCVESLAVECYGCEDCTTYPKQPVQFTKLALYKGSQPVCVSVSPGPPCVLSFVPAVSCGCLALAVALFVFARVSFSARGVLRLAVALSQHRIRAVAPPV